MKKRILLLLVVFVFGVLTACAEEVKQEEKIKAIDERGILYEINNSDVAKIKSVKSVQLLQGNVLIETSKQLLVISPKTGETLCKKKIDKDNKKVLAQVCGDKIVVVESSEEFVFKVLDSKLKELETYSLQKEGEVICLNKDATKVFCYQEPGTLVLKDMVSGEREVLLDGIAMYENGQNTIFTEHTNTNKYILDLDNSTVKEIWSFSQKDVRQYCDDNWMAMNTMTFKMYIGNHTHSYTLEMLEDFPDMVELVNGDADICISSVDDKGEETVRFYTVDGTLVSEQSFESPMDISLPLWSEDVGGYYIVKTVTNVLETKSTLLFWDMQIPVEGKNMDNKLEYVYDAETDEQGMQLCRGKVAELSKKYGVELKIGNECETDYDVYRAVLELRPERIYEGLCVLDKAFSLYPDGFVSQMAFGKHKMLKATVVGALIPQKADRIGASAFVTYRKERTELVVGINNMGLERIIYHEMMHVIDYRLDYDKYMGFSKVYDEEAWKALNPKGFQYFAEYKQALSEEDKEQVENYSEWFVDEHGMTNTYEDRATILEAATMGEVDVFKDSPHLIKKLDYLCKYIRQGLDTTGWPEKMPWEETLDKCRQ